MTAPTPNAPAGVKYWCRACPFVAFSAEQSIAHHEGTGHSMTHRLPAGAGAGEEPSDERMLRVWHDRWKARATELESALLAARREVKAAREIADKALKLAEEVAAAHRDRGSPDYNACEKPDEACQFCVETKALRAALAATPEEK